MMSQTDGVTTDDWLATQTVAETDEEGQLALDAYQTEDDAIVKAPIAGVSPEDIEIAITDEVVTVKGSRRREETVNFENYFTQECYWGSFSRSYLLPVAVDSEKAKAVIKNGILTITVPKQEKTKTRIVKVEAGT
ncbi:hypothetical protein COT79_01075 [Candidatus Berkelbacteria bacterium CG10_big_fil_rev_8_21_14_0_10_43_14]|uniref:SHSP domain-containing protein n=1 Tax=Candidatus Berkelbacteria bacterium CG10_big_fil_rev_8_21_14_0_10_43_14 TaxID=1974515 RepID=A0A2M6R8X9_9BACT|nr:MAG: hypothetical protein COT79_01075 [Candidatus Berkelbacteria bacterium CG10_big_fil_rev_8_21_14_0_10_43_14]